jgi:hypothetical protein
MCELQQGVTANFSVSGNTMEILSIGAFGAPIPVIDNTDVSSTISRRKWPGQLRDAQQFTIRCRNIGHKTKPAVGVVQTLTITHPLFPGKTTPEILDGSGFVVDVTTPEFNSDSENRQTYDIIWQYNGSPFPTRTAATPA